MADLPSVSVTPLQPFDLNKGLGAISTLIGLKQQQQALQTGQYTQASAQAKAQQDQQSNQAITAAQQTVINGAKSGKYTKEDGTFDRAKAADDVTASGGIYAAPYATQLLSAANELTQNQQAIQNLTTSKRKVIGDGISALAADPQIDHSKIINGIEAIREQYPNDKEMSRLLTSMGTGLPNNADSATLQKTLATAASMLKGTPVMTPSTIDSGATIQPGATNAYTGAFQPAGAPIQKTVAPSIQELGTGQKGLVTQGGVTPLPGAANLNTQQQQTFAAQAKGVSDRVEQAKVAANNTVGAQDALNRAKALLESPESPNTGSYYDSFKALKNTMSTLGIDTKGADDMNTLSKNLARYEAARATQAGLGGTDAARELAHAGSPNTSLDNKALLGVVRQSLASEKAIQSYAKVQSKTTDPQALVKNENDFRNIPNLIEAHEYGMAKSPEEAEAFLQRHGLTKEQMARSRAAIKEFDSR